MVERAAAEVQQRWCTDELLDRVKALGAGAATWSVSMGSKVVPPMLKASAPMALSPAWRPVKAAPGSSGLAALMLPNSESRLMLPKRRHQRVGDGAGRDGAVGCVTRGWRCRRSRYPLPRLNASNTVPVAGRSAACELVSPLAAVEPVTTSCVLVKPNKFVTSSPVVMVPTSEAFDPLPL